eukprot:3370412-Amphidinium_carterae.2
MAERAAEPPARQPARDVWSHLSSSERQWTLSAIDELRRQLTAQHHNLPPHLWWRHYGRTPENDHDAEALIVHGGGKRSLSVSASSSSPTSSHDSDDGAVGSHALPTVDSSVVHGDQKAWYSLSPSSSIDYAIDDSAYGETGDCSTTAVPIGSVVHMPEEKCADPLMDCIAWVVHDSLFPKMSFPETYARIRLLAWFWFSSALRHGYLVCGVPLGAVASKFGIDPDCCPQFLSDARLPANGAQYLIYAISCFFQIKVCVVDKQGTPLDGFTYVNCLGLHYSSNQWCAVRLGTYVAPETSDLSPTLPFLDPAAVPSRCSLPSSQEVLPPHHATGVNCEFVVGGTRVGALWRRSILQLKSSLRKGRAHSPNKYVILRCGKAQPLRVEYQGRISTKDLIAAYASRKRVGRQFLTISFRLKGGVQTCRHSDNPVFVNWHGRTVSLVNNRYATMSRPSVEERRELERNVDHLTDQCIPNPRAQAPLRDIDSYSTAVQKCAVAMLAGEEDAAMPPPPLPAKRPTSQLAQPRKVAEKAKVPGGASCASSSSRAPSAALLPTPTRQVHIQFECAISVPATWTFGDALARIRNHLHPENCVVDIKHPMKISLTVPDIVPTSNLVQGAGRSVRVQHDTVARNALVLVMEDLERARCDRFNEKFLRAVLSRDRKCALAAFQATTAAQRLMSMSAALRRMGLEDKADDILSCTHDIPSDEADAAVHQEAAHPPPRPDQQGQPIMIVASPTPSVVEGVASPPAPQMSLLSRRVEALEAWAHILDCHLEPDASLAEGALSRTQKMLENLVQQAIDKACPQGRLHAAIDGLNASIESMQVQVAALQEKVEHKEFCCNSSIDADADRKVANLAGAMSAVCQKVTAIEQHVLKVTEFTHKIREETRKKPTSQNSAELMALLQMHTNAISQTWQWVSSNIRITQQHAAWIHRGGNATSASTVAAPQSTLQASGGLVDACQPTDHAARSQAVVEAATLAVPAVATEILGPNGSADQRRADSVDRIPSPDGSMDGHTDVDAESEDMLLCHLAPCRQESSPSAIGQGEGGGSSLLVVSDEE